MALTNSQKCERYRKKHPKLISDIKKRWYDRNRDHVFRRTKAYRQKSFNNFLNNMLLNCRHDDKDYNQRHQNKRDFDIDREYLLDLLKLQNGRCAATGNKLTHIHGDINCISIDRIDSSIGHVKGNIQLVCQGYNMAKQNRPDIEGRLWIQEIQMNLLKKLKEKGYLINFPQVK